MLQICLIQIMHCVCRIMKSCESWEMSLFHLIRIIEECDLNHDSLWLESQLFMTQIMRHTWLEPRPYSFISNLLIQVVVTLIQIITSWFDINSLFLEYVISQKIQSLESLCFCLLSFLFERVIMNIRVCEWISRKCVVILSLVTSLYVCVVEHNKKDRELIKNDGIDQSLNIYQELKNPFSLRTLIETIACYS